MNKQDNQELRTNKQELISKYELIKNSYKFDTVSMRAWKLRRLKNEPYAK